MKKMLLIAALAVFGFSTAQAQNMKAGVGVAIPMGDLGDAASFGLTGDFTYFFEINEAFYVGPQASILYYFAKEYDTGFGKVKGDNLMFLPIAASARFNLEDLFFGADLGYGIGLAPSGNDGGFFYRPKVGYNFGSLAALLSYSGISSKQTVATPFGTVSSTTTFGSINLGVEFSF